MITVACGPCQTENSDNPSNTQEVDTAEEFTLNWTLWNLFYGQRCSCDDSGQLNSWIQCHSDSAVQWYPKLSCGISVYHAQLKLLKSVPESCLLILLGVVVGVILHLADADNIDRHQLNTRTFFFILLPPIIIDAGYFIPARSFFDQLGTIIVYAVIGTMVSSWSLGRKTL